jgi:hypothetical protein
LPYHLGHSRRPVQPYYGRAVAPRVTTVTLTDTPSAIRHGGPDGSLAIDLVLSDTSGAQRLGGAQGAGPDVALAIDTPSALRHAGQDGALVIGDVYTDTPSALRCGGPSGTLVTDLAITDTPSALRAGGPDGSSAPGISLGPDTPGAVRYGGPDGLVSPNLAVTSPPAALRHSGPDGSVVIGVALTGDSPSGIRHSGPSGSVFADVGAGVNLTDTPSALRQGGPDAGAFIGVVIVGDSPSASHYGGPDGVNPIGTAVTDTPSASRYSGPVGVLVIIAGGTDTPSALRAGGPDGLMGVEVPITGDSPSASRYGGAVGSVSIGIGNPVNVGPDTPGGTRYGGPDGQVMLAFLPVATPYVSPAPIYLPGYTLWVADTVTGRFLWELPLESMSWANNFGSDGSISATLDIEKTWDTLSDQDERDPRILVRELLSGPWRFCLVVIYGSNPVWAGPYISMSRPKPTQVQLGGAEIGKIFAKRVLIAPGAISPNDVTADTVIGPNTTKGHAAYVLINQAMIGTGRSLPIIVSDPAGSDIDYRTYYGYDLRKVADALRDLSNESDGPELRFDPQIYAGSDANYLRWVVQIGAPHLGRGITPWCFDDDVSVVTTLDTDASNMALSIYSAGAGSSRDKVIATASDTTLLSIGYPLLEEVDTAHSSQESYPILATQAVAQLGLQKQPAVSFKVQIPVDRDPNPGQYHIGEDFQITVQDDPVVPDGVYSRRIAGISGTEQPWVTLTDTDPLPVGAS